MSPSDDRCVHGLLPDQCGYCVQQTGDQAALDRRIRATMPLIDWAELARVARTPRPSRPFPAAFDSECGGCDDMIYEGDEIRRFEGQAMHSECAESEAEE